MKLLSLIEFLLRQIRKLRKAGIALLLALVALDWLFVDKGDTHTAFEAYPAFWALFGFVACVVIIFCSRWFGQLGIKTREDLYDDER